MLTIETSNAKNPVLTVICGANVHKLKRAAGFSIAYVRGIMTELCSITNEHTICMINGRVVSGDLNKQVLRGDEEIEFKKPSGQKG